MKRGREYEENSNSKRPHLPPVNGTPGNSATYPRGFTEADLDPESDNDVSVYRSIHADSPGYGGFVPEASHLATNERIQAIVSPFARRQQKLAKGPRNMRDGLVRGVFPLEQGNTANLHLYANTLLVYRADKSANGYAAGGY